MTLVVNTLTNDVSQEFSVATFLTYAHLHPSEPPSLHQTTAPLLHPPPAAQRVEFGEWPESMAPGR